MQSNLCLKMDTFIISNYAFDSWWPQTWQLSHFFLIPPTYYKCYVFSFADWDVLFSFDKARMQNNMALRSWEQSLLRKNRSPPCLTLAAPLSLVPLQASTWFLPVEIEEPHREQWRTEAVVPVEIASEHLNWDNGESKELNVVYVPSHYLFSRHGFYGFHLPHL